MEIHRFLAPAAGLGLLFGMAHAQGIVEIQPPFHPPEGPSLTLRFRNVASVPDTGLANSFLIETATDLADAWQTQAAVVSSVPGAPGFHTATLTWTAEMPQRFFRITGQRTSGSPGDPDGDGLTAEIEALLGTNLNRFDTDGDGFSDGQEYAYGTKPLDPNSRPVPSTLPTVSFLAFNSPATEGTSPYQLPVIFNKFYSGTLNYAVNSLSTANPGTDFTLGGNPTATRGSITVNGTSATIPLTLLDDSLVSGQRAIIIDLQLNGNNYVIGGRPSHVVILSDNDAWWTGSLLPASGEIGARTFRLRITHQAATTAAVFGAGVGQDGLAVPPGLSGSSASVSTAIFPAGQWPGTDVVDTAAHFHVTSPVIIAPRRTGGALAGSQPLGRRLELNAQPSLNAPGRLHSLAVNSYFGEYTEALTRGTKPAGSYRGTFILVRDTPAPLPVLSNLLP